VHKVPKTLAEIVIKTLIVTQLFHIFPQTHSLKKSESLSVNRMHDLLGLYVTASATTQLLNKATHSISSVFLFSSWTQAQALLFNTKHHTETPPDLSISQHLHSLQSRLYCFHTDILIEN